MSNVGRWNTWNVGDEPAPYADTESYRIAAEWLDPCSTMEDWGCGRRWFATLRPNGYVGVDGSGTYADRLVDLVGYRSTVEGILLRHVLEHNHQWHAILDNAVASFTRRMCLIVFTPEVDETRVIAEGEVLRAPDIAFADRDLTDRLAGCRWTVETIRSASQYGSERIFRIEKEEEHDGA